MRTQLPRTRPNGHGPEPGQVFVITGMCQEPRFRLGFGAADENDFCLIYLGAAQIGDEPETGGDLEGGGGDPYFVLRRYYDQRQAVVTLRVDWDGIFTLMANDDHFGDKVYAELVEPGRPDEVRREWSTELATLRLYAELLYLI